MAIISPAWASIAGVAIRAMDTTMMGALINPSLTPSPLNFNVPSTSRASLVANTSWLGSGTTGEWSSLEDYL